MSCHALSVPFAVGSLGAVDASALRAGAVGARPPVRCRRATATGCCTSFGLHHAVVVRSVAVMRCGERRDLRQASS